jgi:hypothetical protein
MIYSLNRQGDPAMKFKALLCMLVVMLMLGATGACNHTMGYGNNPPTQNSDGGQGGESGGSY